MVTIYFAGSLFNTREQFFNIKLTELLEEEGYKVFLPQRDGFEFSNILKEFQKHFSLEESKKAVTILIYLLDIGYFTYNSDVILANLDEPIDEGVVVEITYGKFMGKNILSYRTEVRTNYGCFEDYFKGLHSFPAFQSDKIIFFNPNESLENIKEKIVSAIKTFDKKESKIVEEYERIVYYANLIFKNRDVNSVIENYKKYKEELLKLFPEKIQ